RRVKYTQDDLKKLVEKSRSLRQVILALGLNEAGGNYLTLKKKIKEWNIDISHFLGQGHLKGGFPHNTISVKDVLTNKKYLKSFGVKEKLLKAGLLQYKCGNVECGITQWQGKSIVLELDHIDGNKYNNQIENLRLLCPNCHSQTKTWRGRKNK